jgi:high affinity sulfate transporter 1
VGTVEQWAEKDKNKIPSFIFTLRGRKISLSSEKSSGFKKKLGVFLPVIIWLPKYDRKKLFRPDLIAGISLAAFSVPELMAYAELAGLPPEYGLYAGIVAAITYFFFGTIKQFVIGPSSSQAIMVASVIGIIAVSPEHYLDLAMATAILVGIIFLAARVFRLGFIVNLIPVSVLKGFLAGVGLVIIGGQLYKLFGLEGGGGNFFEDIAYVFQNLGETNLPTLAVGLGFMALLLGIEHKYPKLPASLIVVALSIILMTITNLEGHGVHIIGEIPSGLPSPRVPELQQGDLQALLPLAAALFLLSYVESMSIGRTYAKKNGYKIDENQELVAIGTTNITTGRFQGFPVSGSFSRTAINDSAGGITPVSTFSSGIIIAIVALFLTGLFYNMPEVIIAVLVIVAVYKMVDIKELKRVRSHSHVEFFIAMISMALVLILGVLEGVIFGVILSFIYMLYRIAATRVRELGRVPGTHIYRDIERHPENKTIPGIKILRVDAPLLFANAVNAEDKILARVEADPETKQVILDLESSPIIDLSATDMLSELYEKLDEKGIKLFVANPTSEVRDAMRLEGLDKKIPLLERIDGDTVSFETTDGKVIIIPDEDTW